MDTADKLKLANANSVFFSLLSIASMNWTDCIPKHVNKNYEGFNYSIGHFITYSHSTFNSYLKLKLSLSSEVETSPLDI